MNKKERLLSFLKSHPNDAFSLYALALEERKDNNSETAENLFRKVISVEPENLGAYYQLAELLVERDASEDALKVIEQAIIQASEQNDTHSLNEFKELKTIHFS